MKQQQIKQFQIYLIVLDVARMPVIKLRYDCKHRFVSIELGKTIRFGEQTITRQFDSPSVYCMRFKHVSTIYKHRMYYYRIIYNYMEQLPSSRRFEEDLPELQQAKGGNKKLYSVLIVVILGVAIGITIGLYMGVTMNIQSIKQPACKQTMKDMKITFIWIGPKNISDEYNLTLQNAEFNYELLGNKEQKYYQRMFNKHFNVTYDFEGLQIFKRSDAFRFIYLYFNGGLYFDLDFDFDQICLKKVKTLMSQMNHFTGDRQKLPNIQADVNIIFVRNKFDPIIKDCLIAGMADQFNSLGRKLDVARMPVIKLRNDCKHRFDRTWQKDPIWRENLGKPKKI